MKKYLLITCGCLLLAASIHAQQNRIAKFNTYEWDFGPIEAARGAVCHTFTMRNISKTPILFGKPVTSCECIKAIYPQNAISPGEETKVMVVLTPATLNGKTSRSSQTSS